MVTPISIQMCHVYFLHQIKYMLGYSHVLQIFKTARKVDKVVVADLENFGSYSCL